MITDGFASPIKTFNFIHLPKGHGKEMSSIELIGDVLLVSLGTTSKEHAMIFTRLCEEGRRFAHIVIEYEPDTVRHSIFPISSFSALVALRDAFTGKYIPGAVMACMYN